MRGIYVAFFFVSLIAAVPTFIVLRLATGERRAWVAATIGFMTGLVAAIYLFWFVVDPPETPFRYRSEALAIGALLGGIIGPWLVVRTVKEPPHPTEKWTPPRKWDK